METNNDLRPWVAPSLEGWEPKPGDLVRFRLGEREPWVCPNCGLVMVVMLDKLAELSGRTFRVCAGLPVGCYRCTYTSPSPAPYGLSSPQVVGGVLYSGFRAYLSEVEPAEE